MLTAASMTGCGNPSERAVDELRAAIERTSVLSRRFVYQDAALGAPPLVVKGVVEDDVRRQARVEIAGTPAMDSVTRDDALAVRFFGPGDLLAGLTRLDDGAEVIPPGGGPVLDALGAGQWVRDPSGNPVIFQGAATEQQLGEDPIADATDVLDYVEDVIREMPLVELNTDAIEYRPEDDPFPVPSDQSGTTRYDFVRPPLPRAAETGGASGSLPGERHFRRMAVYVKAGLVTRVLEEIDVEGVLDDIAENYGIRLPGTPQQQVAGAIAAINEVRLAEGTLNVIRVRRMSLDIFEVGAPHQVEMPADAVEGDLSVLINRGRSVVAGANQS